MPGHTLVHLASQIHSARKAAGLSVAELSRRSGISRPTIALIEAGSAGRVEGLARVARELGLELVLRPTR